MDIDDIHEITPGVDSLTLEPVISSPNRKTFTRSHGLIDDALDYPDSDDCS